jgi:hypothetical protein
VGSATGGGGGEVLLEGRTSVFKAEAVNEVGADPTGKEEDFVDTDTDWRRWGEEEDRIMERREIEGSSIVIFLLFCTNT